MKLLLVSAKTEQSKGGIAVWTDIFLKKCRQYDICCDLLNIATIGERAKHGNSKRNFANEFVRTKTIFCNLREMLRNQAYDVAHVNTSCATFGLIRDYLIVCRIKKQQPSCKVIVHFHCDVKVQCRTSISRFFLGQLLRISDKSLVLNKRNYHYLHKNYRVESEIVANFIDDSMICSKEKTIGSEIKEAIFVGYVRPEKGIKELYELAQHFPEITFRLIGEIHKEVATWDKPDNVILCGKKERHTILSDLDQADIFVFLSHSEGFSIALLESMARGLPCIATDVGANSEMLEDKGGLIVPVGDTSAMVHAVSTMRASEVREYASKWNLQKVQEQYTLDIVMGILRNIYDF